LAGSTHTNGNPRVPTSDTITGIKGPPGPSDTYAMTQTNATANAYLRTKVLTANPEELRLLLLDGSIKFLRQGIEGLAQRDWEAVFDGFSKCRNIVLELINSMKPEIDPELCSRVTSLYTFLYTQLVEAGFDKDAPKAEKVLSILEYERETWVLAMERAAEERGAKRQTPAAVTERPRASTLSLQG
jgi:flagellar protein FliS